MSNQRDTISKHLKQTLHEMGSDPAQVGVLKSARLIREEIKNYEDLKKIILQCSGMVQWVLMEADCIRRDCAQVTVVQKLQAMKLVNQACALHSKIVKDAICLKQALGEAPTVPKPKNLPPSFMDEPESNPTEAGTTVTEQEQQASGD